MGAHQGRKYASSHTTAIEGAYALLREAEKMDEVSKISLGFIRMIRGKSGSKGLKIKQESSGLLLNVRVGSSLQEIRIYTAHPEKVAEALQKSFG